MEKVASRLCRYPVGQKFRQNRSILLHFRDKRFFCILRRNSRWPPKVEGKQFSGEVTSRLYRYPADKKFGQNHSISLRFRDKHVFCSLRRNSRWLPKVAGKRFLGKVASRLCRYPAHKKFRQNRSISLRFRGKHVFAFYAEIHDGCQKWRENVLLQKVASRLCRYPVGQKIRRNRSISLHFQNKRFFCFTQIQDDHQKLGETIFRKKLPLDYADTL